jgi:hypothetical protein
VCVCVYWQCRGLASPRLDSPKPPLRLSEGGLRRRRRRRRRREEEEGGRGVPKQKPALRLTEVGQKKIWKVPFIVSDLIQ